MPLLLQESDVRVNLMNLMSLSRPGLTHGCQAPLLACFADSVLKMTLGGVFPGALKTRGTKRFGAAATPSLEQDGATLRDGE